MSRPTALAIFLCIAALSNAQYRMEPKVKARSERMFAKLAPTARIKVQEAADRILQRPGPLEPTARQATIQAFPQTLGNASNADIEAVAFIVLSQAESDAQSDLQAIMNSIKAINAQKAALRSQIAKVQSMMAGQQPPTHKPYRFKLARTPHLKLAYPIIEPIHELPKDLPTMSQANLQALLEQLQEEQNALSDMSTQDQMALQQAMQQKSQFETMLSNILKKMSDTDSSIIANLK